MANQQGGGIILCWYRSKKPLSPHNLQVFILCCNYYAKWQQCRL